VVSGTLDLANNTVDRAGTGSGALTVANSCTLKLQGTFPANFSTYTLAPTSLTEFYGGSQVVPAITYGHMNLTSPSGTVSKSISSPIVKVVGNLSSSVSSGSLSVTALGSLQVSGNVTFGSSVTFAASSFAHTFSGNVINNGIINGGTGTVTFSGLNALVSGAAGQTHLK